MNIDFEELVKQAIEGNPGGLLHAMQQHASYIWATEQRKLSKADDWPPCVANLLIQFGRVSQPNGRPMNSRPPKDLQQLALAYRAWFRYVIRHSFEVMRVRAKNFKSAGGREIIGNRDFPMRTGSASDIAYDAIEEQTGMTKNSVNDILYPNRRNKYTKE